MKNDEMLSEREAAELLGVAPKTLQIWRCYNRYNLKFLRVGRMIRYRRADLQEWLESRVFGGASPSKANASV